MSTQGVPIGSWLTSIHIAPSRLAPSASALIYGGVEAESILVNGAANALRVPDTDIRPSASKTERLVKRRMGIPLAFDA